MGRTDGGCRVRALRNVALECLGPSTATPMLPEPILPALRDLIGCDSTHFLWMDVAREELDYLPPQDFIPDVDDCQISREEEAAMWWEHHNSECCQPRVPDDVSSAPAETDTMSVRQWRACSRYELYKASGGEHLMILRIPDGPGEHSGCSAGEVPEKASPNGTRPTYSCSGRTLRRHTDASQRIRAVSALTARQRQLLELVAQGYTNYQIARRLGVTEGTIRAHLYQIYSRLGVSSRTAAVTRSLITVED